MRHGVDAADGRPRLYTFEVFLIDGPARKPFAVGKRNRISRTIEMRGDQRLSDLHACIFGAFDRYDEHMYEFQVGGKGPMDPAARRFVLPNARDGLFGTTRGGVVTTTAIDSLGLRVGEAFGYWFDFGDDWWHQINVIGIADTVPAGEYPRVIARRGESPPQYPDVDEDDE